MRTVLAAIGGNVASPHAPASLRGLLSNPTGPADATLAGTVSRAYVEGWEGTVSYWRPVVVLAGEEIPLRDLHGEISLTESIDSPIRLFELTLLGESYSPLLTERSWTRRPISVSILRGDGVTMVSEPLVEGLVLDGTPALDGLGVRLRCGDAASALDGHQLCFELEPLAGYSRGDVAREACADAGLLETDIPPGNEIRNGISTQGQEFWSFLQALGAPENWSWEMKDGKPTVYIPELKEPPYAPDHVWTPSDWESLELHPPKDVPSRRILRSDVAIAVDDAGIETKTTRTTITAAYAPLAADREQQNDGTVSDLTVTSAEADRIISVIEVIESSRGGRVLGQVTREWGWYNPASAHLRTPVDSEPDGPADGGYYYVQTYLEQGSSRAVAWRVERFVLIGERRETWTYDDVGTVLAQHVTTLAWRGREAAVKQADGAWVLGRMVATDGVSYRAGADVARVVESFGLVSEDLITYTYGPSGQVAQERTEQTAWYSPRGRIDATSANYLMYDGTGRTETAVTWRTVRVAVKTNLTDEDGLLLGTVEAEQGWKSSRRIGGLYDWGEYESDQAEEVFGSTQVKQTAVTILDEGSYELVTTSPSGQRTSTVVHGPLPKPRYQSSAWTSLVQEPIEFKLDDPVAEEWFGFRRGDISNGYVQSEAEAEALVRRTHRREMSHVVTVRRCLCSARGGETVLLVDPTIGLRHRALIREVKRTLTPATGAMAGEYTLEVAL